jgi:DNA replication protein DnaC
MDPANATPTTPPATASRSPEWRPGCGRGPTEAELADFHAAEAARKRAAIATEQTQAFVRAAGTRYSGCTLENFVAVQPAQRDALRLLREYRDALAGHLDAGEGLLLVGASGTGKDHLLAALARAAIQAGKSIAWKNGPDLFGEFRDAIEAERSEDSIFARLTTPDVLVLCDPVPPRGTLTPYQSAQLYRLVDRRYRDRRAIWCSINAANSVEADERIGPAIVDRLLHAALVVRCNWPSFRRPLRQGSQQSL